MNLTSAVISFKLQTDRETELLLLISCILGIVVVLSRHVDQLLDMVAVIDFCIKVILIILVSVSWGIKRR